jgi:ABC-2 type transport system ATP-binding protein
VITDHPQSAADLLKGEMDRWRVSLFGDRLHVIIDDDPSAGIGGLKRRLESRGVHVFQAYEERYSLEDVFIAVVEQARRNGKVATGD